MFLNSIYMHKYTLLVYILNNVFSQDSGYVLVYLMISGWVIGTCTQPWQEDLGHSISIPLVCNVASFHSSYWNH